MSKKAERYVDRADFPPTPSTWLAAIIRKAMIRAYDAGIRAERKRMNEEIRGKS